MAWAKGADGFDKGADGPDKVKGAMADGPGKVKGPVVAVVAVVAGSEASSVKVAVKGSGVALLCLLISRGDLSSEFVDLFAFGAKYACLVMKL